MCPGCLTMPGGSAQCQSWAPAETTRPVPSSKDQDLTPLYRISYPCSLCRDALPRVVQSWARNYIFCVALYCMAGGLWAYYIYACYGATLFGAGNMPAWPDMLEQIKVGPLLSVASQQACLTGPCWNRGLHAYATMCGAELTGIGVAGRFLP